jgi:hypothetical protein
VPRKIPADVVKTAFQVFAVLCLVAFFAMLFHKAALDISTLVRQFPGSEFWTALGRHLLRNLGGG